jgi:hypothetical protein
LTLDGGLRSIEAQRSMHGTIQKETSSLRLIVSPNSRIRMRYT